MNINAVYENLAFDLSDGDSGAFISGWQCDNKYINDFIDSVRRRSFDFEYHRYIYFDEDEILSKKILDLHELFDGIRPQGVLCASGSTPILYSFVSYLKKLGVDQIYYIPPIYFTLHVAFELYGIKAISLSQKQPFEKNFCFNLPQEKTIVLFLTDPIWYTGTKFSEDSMVEISKWQEKTSSLVFVDGSLQYLPWNFRLKEYSSMLNSDYTFRLICPTKQLSIHGYRFSYLILPSSHQRGFAWTYANISGPTSVDSIIFAHESIGAIKNRNIPDRLMREVVKRYKYLRHHNVIESEHVPECGYFVFEKINIPLPDKSIVMDQKYFDLNGYKGYVKINLLSPSINILYKDKY